MELAETDRNIMLLTADLGFSVFEELEDKFPDQYINVGIAEQNMIGVAAGLALEGKKIFAYSIGNFPTLRCLEQIRNNICYHDLNVNIISMGGGFSYGALGMTHHATEDLSILRSLPNMTVLAPSGEEEAYQLVTQVIERPGPSYIRLDKTIAKSNEGKIEIGKLHQLTDGADVVIFVIGGVLYEVEKAVDRLKEKGLGVSVVSVHTLKPLDEKSVLRICRTCRAVVTVEENNIYGGLGSAISEILCKNETKVKCIHLGIKDTYISQVGDQSYLRSITGLSSENIEAVILSLELI
jgi:transketolase